jgi:hypothetical protein
LGYCKGTCTSIFIAALFTIAKDGNSQDALLPTHGLRKCGIYAKWNFIQPQRDEILSFISKWMELENIILSEVCQGQKAKNCMCSLICGL